MNSREYWRERALILNNSLMQDADELLPHIEKAYEEALISIENDINVFYQKFAADNELTFLEATRKLSSSERKKFKMAIEKYIKKAEEVSLDEKWVKRLKNASTVNNIDRLTSLKLQMQQQVEVLEEYKAQSLTRTLAEIYQESYYRTAYEIQKGLGVGTAFATLDVNKINKVLAKPWSPDGENFSEKIWGRDRANLIHQLNTRFTQGIIRGETPQRIFGDMAKVLNSSKTAASRLVLTEAAAFSAMAQEDSYKELEIEEFEYVAALDEVTCELCGALDGQHFPMSEYSIGEFVPPLHPWCRCTTVPYFNDEFTEEQKRVARDENGETYYVPADMTYEEWKNKLKPHAENDKLSEEEVLAVNKYITAKSYELNEKLRIGEELSEEEELMVNNLSSALKKMPKYEGIVYRSVSEFGIDDVKEFINSHIPGEFNSFSQFLSSGVEVYDEDFPIQYVIKSKTGRDIRNFNPGESEVLFDRDTSFLIEKRNGNTIYMKEV